MPEIRYPVQLHEHLTNISELVAHKMLREMTDIIQREEPKLDINCAECLAAYQLIRWYSKAEEDLEIIRSGGIAMFISSYERPRVLATLYGLKHALYDAVDI